MLIGHSKLDLMGIGILLNIDAPLRLCDFYIIVKQPGYIWSQGFSI